jgi:hypothetical protein
MAVADDLAELGLSPGDEGDKKKIRKAYLKLSCSRHPDKGGSTESFQRLSNAYTRLAHPEDEEEVEEEPSPAASAAAAADHRASSYDYANQWYRYYNDFFHEYGFSDHEDEFEAWETSEEERRRAWSRHHQQELRQGRDFRDEKAKSGEPKCMFCGTNAPIKEGTAEAEGLNWEEYARSINIEGYPSYNTCWVCKTKKRSVLTESQACTKFAKKLDFHIQSRRTGTPYRPVFWKLKVAGRSFHHQPVTNMHEGPTRNSEYFWYPDLEREALARGWKPRGAMKNEVPWRRKDMSEDLVVHTSPAKTKTKKAAPMVTPTPSIKRRQKDDSDDGDKKPRAKPRKLNY